MFYAVLLLMTRYTTFISIHWSIQKFVYSSDTMFHPAGWSSNLHGDETELGGRVDRPQLAYLYISDEI